MYCPSIAPDIECVFCIFIEDRIGWDESQVLAHEGVKNVEAKSKKNEHDFRFTQS